MKHHRQAIRDKIIEILKAAHIPGVFDQIGGRPFFQLPGVPYISVADVSETVRTVATGYEREVTFAVHVAVKIEDGADDMADAICAFIEINLPLQLEGLAQDGWLTDMQAESSGEGEQQILVKTLVFVFKYVTEMHNPTASIH